MRCIDADAFEVVAFEDRDETFADGVQWILEKIDAMPTIEPERKKGTWRRMPMACYGGGIITEYECSVCGEHQIITSNYCPDCGARMGGDES